MSGHIVNVDNRSEFGGDDLDPMELVLMWSGGMQRY
jgi:hypothetical protein